MNSAHGFFSAMRRFFSGSAPSIQAALESHIPKAWQLNGSLQFPKVDADALLPSYLLPAVTRL